MNYTQVLKSALLVMLLPPVAISQDGTPTNSIALRSQAIRAMQSGESSEATKAADALLELAPNDARTLRLVGDVYLRSGDVDAAVKQFDRYLKLEPEALPGLWQRGIALYFAGKYGEGVKQFEVHRGVNPNDVENAAWHFLCVAKSRSFEEAEKLVLPAPNDARVPMAEVLEMLSDGDTDRVVSKMESVAAGSPDRDDADFYGNFYLGLYADAQGDEAKALRYLKKSAEDVPHHYMGDVARVYVAYLEERTESAK
ncbi:MAG: tetratricopeptide repeat protein [Rubripirellula sp.]